MTQSRRATLRVWGLIAVLAGAATLMYLGPVDGLPQAAPPLHLPWWVLAAAFAAAEYFVVHLHLRRDAHSLSLSELPLLLGLAFLSPAALLVARLGGAAFTLVLFRRQSLTKLAFNLALFALEVVLGLLIFRSVLGGAEPLHLRSWVAAGLATVAIDVTGTIAITMAIWLYEGRVHVGMLREVGTIGTFLALCNASVAVLVLTVTWTNSDAMLPLLVVAGFMYMGYRSYLTLRQRHANLQMLYRFTSATARSGETRAAAAGMLAEVRELLRCDIAEFALIEPGGTVELRIRLVGERIIGDDDLPPLRPEDAEWCLARTAATARYTMGAEAPGLRGYLRGIEVKDAIAAPVELSASDGMRGVVLAINRVGEASTFDEDDAELFTALARHAGVALENGRLVERLRAEAVEKEHQALHDGLTGLPNRTLLRRRLDTAITRATEKQGGGAAVLLLDLDRFKQVNDTLGHAAGDRLLQEVARRLADSVRPDDTVARLGGDEFAIVLQGVGTRVAHDVAGRIHAALGRPCTLDGIVLDIGASIGIALYPDHAEDADTLLKHADVAMYTSKRGDGLPATYAADDDDNSPRRLAMAGELRNALELGAIDVHYQPKIRLADGVPIGVEALARWTDPVLGEVRPAEFIPIAEQTGLIGQLTLHILEQALHDVAAWRAVGIDLDLAVNLSARTVVDLDFPYQLQGMLRRTGADAAGLTLEVTESSMLTDRDRAVEVLTRLSELGVRLSIDDFGTGFSSMAHLTRLPVHELKIDRGFVGSMCESASDAVIVRTITELGHNLGLRVVAEGVEDAATCAAVTEMGCAEAQGYLWSPALPAPALCEWVIRNPGGDVPGLRAVTPLRAAADR